MRKNHAEILITSDSVDKPRPVDILVPEPVAPLSRFGRFNSSNTPLILNTYCLFFKYLYGLIPYTSQTTTFNLTCNNRPSLVNLKNFTLESLLINRSLNVINSDSLNFNFYNAEVISQSNAGIFKFNHIVR